MLFKLDSRSLKTKGAQFVRDSAGWDQLSTEELLQLCLTSEGEIAWFHFVCRYQPVIAAVISKTLRLRWMHPNSGLVDDLVQNTYLKLCADDFKALREFNCRHEHSLAGFLKVIASNVTQDYLRSSLCQKRGSGTGEEDIERAIPVRSVLDGFATRMEREILLRQVEQCVKKQASEPNFERDCKIFRLYYWQGFTAQAISRRADVRLSVKGVESALHRLMKLLRSKLGGSSRLQHRPAEESDQSSAAS